MSKPNLFIRLTDYCEGSTIYLNMNQVMYFKMDDKDHHVILFMAAGPEIHVKETYRDIALFMNA